MKVGDLVKVQTKWYGEQMGFLVEEVEESYGTSWLICPTNHPRNVRAEAQDIEVISESR